MSSNIILYGGLAVAILTGVLDVYEIVARRTFQRRIEQEYHLALLRLLAKTFPDTVRSVTAAQYPQGMASTLATGHSGGKSLISVQGNDGGCQES